MEQNKNIKGRQLKYICLVIVVVVVVVVFVAIDKDLQMYNSTTNKYTKNEVDVW